MVRIVSSTSSDGSKGTVNGKQIKHGQKLRSIIFAQVVPASGQQSHPEATSDSMSCNVPALRAGFSKNQNNHHGVLPPRTVGVKSKGMLHRKPIT